MGNKKKSCNVSLYMSLVILSLVCFFYMFVGSCSYAITVDELDYFLSNAKSYLTNNNLTTTSLDYFISHINDVQSTVQNYDSIFVFNIGVQPATSFQIVYYNFDDVYISNISGNYNIYPRTNTTQYYVVTAQSTNIIIQQRSVDRYGYNLTNTNLLPIFSNREITLNKTTTVFTDTNLVYGDLQPSETIDLISSSNHKFGFNDKNQCRAYITGYDVSDITFYVDRFINNDWEQFTNASEYYRLLESDDPYYIYWANMNYFPVGTYRYRAVYDYDNQFTSDSFTITNMIIDNDGTYSNGNISIDTGNTVDNIKDYFGGQVDTSIGNINEDDIENSLGLERTQNPYENFVYTLVDGLLDSLVGTSPEYISFKVHSWGQTFKIYVEDIVPNYGTDLRNFLTLISTVVVILYIIRWITKVVESINVADVDTTLDLIEEKYSDLL